MPVHTCENKVVFDKWLEDAGDKLVVVDFTATWCGPCKSIAPILLNMSEELTDVIFLKVDVDASADLAKAQGISCMPTFKFFKQGKELCDPLQGADQDSLKANIEKFK